MLEVAIFIAVGSVGALATTSKIVWNYIKKKQNKSLNFTYNEDEFEDDCPLLYKPLG